MLSFCLGSCFNPERQENARQHGWKVSHVEGFKGKHLLHVCLFVFHEIYIYFSEMHKQSSDELNVTNTYCVLLCS